MGWTLLSLLIMLAIGVPVLNYIYQGFLNTTNGTWLNWTTSNATPATPPGTYTVNTSVPSTFETAYFQFVPIIAFLMVVIFILLLISGKFKRDDQGM